MNLSAVREHGVDEEVFSVRCGCLFLVVIYGWVWGVRICRVCTVWEDHSKHWHGSKWVSCMREYAAAGTCVEGLVDNRGQIWSIYLEFSTSSVP